MGFLSRECVIVRHCGGVARTIHFQYLTAINDWFIGIQKASGDVKILAENFKKEKEIRQKVFFSTNDSA